MIVDGLFYFFARTQQPWYQIYRISMFLFSTRKYFHYMRYLISDSKAYGGDLWAQPNYGHILFVVELTDSRISAKSVLSYEWSNSGLTVVPLC